MSPLPEVLCVAGAYLLGSVPFGVLVTRLVARKDVRTVGSGNIGASNVTRAAGKVAGAATLALDAAKAAVPMLVVARLFAADGPDAARAWSIAAGLAAFLGHLFPVWLGFRGGKGVASALGVFLVLAPGPALVAAAVFAVGVVSTRITAVGSLAAAAVGTAAAFGQAVLRDGAAGLRSPVPWVALGVALAVVLRHRANIARLLAGRENRV